MNRRSSSSFIVLLILGAASLTGCEEDVTAVIGGEGVFSVYGVISPDLEFQSVRVYPFEQVLASQPNTPLDAVVTSTDLMTGEKRVWQDSLVVDAQGQYGHVFWSDFRGRHGHSYRIEVERSDGARSRAEAAVPPRVAVELEEPETRLGELIQPVWVRGGAPRLLYTAVEYFVRPVEFNRASQCYSLPFHTFLWRIPQTGGTQVGNDWLIDVNVTLDYQHQVFDSVAAVLRTLGYEGVEDDVQVILLDMELTSIIASADWHPSGGVFDPEVLVNSETLSNVENGSGFVGAGYRISPNLLPTPEVYRRAGFIGVEDVHARGICG